MAKSTFYSLTVVLSLLTACSSSEVQIVDPQGKPINNALVLSNQAPFIGQRWWLTGGVTQGDGKAPAVARDLVVLAAGYHAVINSQRATPSWLAEHADSGKITLYPVNLGIGIDENQQYLEVSQLDNYSLPFCGDSQLHFDTQQQQLRVSSSQNLYSSDSYYFANANGRSGQQLLVPSDEPVFFYCQGPEAATTAPLYKVGINAVRDGALTVKGYSLVYSVIADKQQLPVPQQPYCGDQYQPSFHGQHFADNFASENPDAAQIHRQFSKDFVSELGKIRPHLPCQSDNINALLDYVITEAHKDNR